MTSRKNKNRKKGKKTILLLSIIMCYLTILITGCTLHTSALAPIKYNYAETVYDIEDGCLNYVIQPGNQDEGCSPIITIYNSYLYQSQLDMRDILIYIINTDKGKECGLSEDDVDYYIAEWVSHNFAHSHPEAAASFLNCSPEKAYLRSTHSDLNTSDPYKDVYLMLYEVLG